MTPVSWHDTWAVPSKLAVPNPVAYRVPDPVRTFVAAWAETALANRNALRLRTVTVMAPYISSSSKFFVS